MSTSLECSVENPLLTEEEAIAVPLDTTVEEELVQGVGNRGSLWEEVYERLF